MKLRMYLRGLGIGLIVASIILSFAVTKKNTSMTDDEIKARAKELGMVEETATLDKIKEDIKESASDTPENVVPEPVVEEVKEAEPATEEVKKAETKVDEEKAETHIVDEKKETPVVEEKAETPKADEKTEKPKSEEADTTEKAEVKIPGTDTISDDVVIEKAKDDLVVNKDDKKAEDKENKEEDKQDVKPVETKVKGSSKTTITVAGGASSDTVAKLLEKGGVIDSASKFDAYLTSHGYDRHISTGTHEIPAGADYETIAKIITSGNR